MAEYIDADALFRAIKNSDWLPHERIEAMKMVREQSTIDAVPVVRCGECERRKKSADLTDSVWCKWYVCEMPKDGFCSYGERKDGDT